MKVAGPVGQNPAFHKKNVDEHNISCIILALWAEYSDLQMTIIPIGLHDFLCGNIYGS